MEFMSSVGRLNLPNIAEELNKISEDLKKRLNGTGLKEGDFELYNFTQNWGSTALGFDGFGGQVLTSAMTYVFIPESGKGNCFVYFGSDYAYTVPFSNIFFQDVIERNVAAQWERKIYLVEND